MVAHPDDIDFGAAGTVAVLTDHGVEVVYGIVTNGQAGRPASLSPAELTTVRAGADRGGSDRGRLGAPLARLPRRSSRGRPRAAQGDRPPDPHRPARPARHPDAGAQPRADLRRPPRSPRRGRGGGLRRLSRRPQPALVPRALLDEGHPPHTVPVACG
ncbi:MAG: PIG-L family deacetylase [Acidimicrobiales bacterium]